MPCSNVVPIPPCTLQRCRKALAKLSDSSAVNVVFWHFVRLETPTVVVLLESRFCSLMQDHVQAL